MNIGIYISISVLLIFFGLILLGWFKKRKRLRNAFKNFGKRLEDKITELNSINHNEVDTKPDLPIDFGFKTNWIAIKTSDQNKVASALDAKNIFKANWKSGLDVAFKKASYITPSINDWILVVNYYPVPDHPEQVKDTEKIIIKLSKEFGEAQLFGTHRGVGFSCWIKAVNGEIKRAYSYIEGENIMYKGEPTEIEKDLNLINTFSKEAEEPDYFENPDLIIPDEDLVMRIAGSWSINPTELTTRNDIRGLGLLIN